MKAYRTKALILSGTSTKDVYKQAETYYKEMKAHTKRRPYIRSVYFNKEKVFLELFWQHLHQKNWRDRARRIKFFPCAIELIRFSHCEPISKENPNNSSELLHRFTGITSDSRLFYVQIKESKHTRQKWFLSVFPEQKVR